MTQQLPESLKRQLELEAYQRQHFVSTLILDKECKLVSFNKWAIERFNLIADKKLTVGNYFPEYLPKPWDGVILSFFEQVLDGGLIDKEVAIPELGNEKPLWVKFFMVKLDFDLPEMQFVALNIINTNAQREAEEVSRQKTKLFEEVFDSGTEGKLVWPFENMKDCICNRKILQLLGINNKEEFTEIYWPLLSQQFQIHPGKIPEESKKEFYIQTSKGRFLAQGQLTIFHLNNDIYGLLKIQDITISKMIENQWKEQDELFRLVSKATNDGVYKYDLNIDQTWCSDEYIKMLGYPADETINHPNSWFMEKINPDDLAEIHQQLEEGRKGLRQQMNLEYRIRHAQGHYLHIIDRGFISTDNLGNPTTVVGAITDVTKIRENEAKLEHSEHILKGILATIEEVVYSFKLYPDLNSEFEFFSKQSGEVWGFHHNELFANENLWIRNIYSDDRKNVIIPALKKLLNFERCDLEYRFKRKDGTTRWIYSQLIPEQTGQGFVRVTGSAMDVTDRKLFEEKLLIQNQELTKINEELDRFVYSASHDLRSPLTSIMGLINLFHYEETSPQHREYLSMIKQSVNRLDLFITNIVDYSRNARLEILYEPVPLAEMLEETLQSLQFMEGYHRVTKNLSITGSVPFYSDPMRIQLILNNLVSNAIKYQRGSIENPQLNVLAHTEPDFFHLEVSDNGVGIDPNLLSRVFDMFFKGEVINHGSGIGLYIVKESVQKLGGEIQVEGQVNAGCRFLIQIPNRYAALIHEENGLPKAATSK